MKVSVIILNWNNFFETIDCLKSFKNQFLKNIELNLIIVDNASENDSLSRIQNFLRKERYFAKQKIEISLTRTKKNLGFAGGNNFGINLALKQKSDFIIILNNDTLVSKRLVKELVDQALKEPKVGLISPKIYFAKGYEFHKERYRRSDLGKVIWYAGGIIDWDNIYGKNLGVDEVDKGQYDRVKEIDFVTGACMLINSNFVKKVGGFDEKYFMYFEDVDLSLKAKNLGWKVLYTFKPFLWHKVARSSGIGSFLNDYFITRNRLLFAFRYARCRTKLALFKESMRFLFMGRKYQKIGVLDFYLGRFGIGSWHN